MDIKLTGKLSGIKNSDLDNYAKTEAAIYGRALDLADELLDKLEEAKLDRLVRFCQTGRME